MAIAAIFGKVAGVFVMVLVGFAASKAGWLPEASSKYLGKIVLNIAAPCAVFRAMSAQTRTPEMMKSMLLIFGVMAVLYLITWFPGTLLARLTRTDKQDEGVFRALVIFQNSGFMGFPVAFAVFGETGLFYMVLANTAMLLLLYSAGASAIRRDGERGRGAATERDSAFKRLRSLCNIPFLSAWAGLALFLFDVPIHEGLGEIIDALAAMMTPLSMIVIGIRLTESKLREIVTNVPLTTMCFARLILMPLLAFLITLPLHADPMVRRILILAFALPSAAVTVSLAEEYAANARLAAEGVFISTMFSMLTLPLVCVVLNLYV